ncbi:MAG: hypothetical protein ABI171_05185 [Collimonas sp.]|uniref:hypothetical protein n=1 Tax=Collimonas sp. TaxID=1963772 RepID=UPI003266620B
MARRLTASGPTINLVPRIMVMMFSLVDFEQTIKKAPMAPLICFFSLLACCLQEVTMDETNPGAKVAVDDGA